jgi:hypothetical protein
MLVIVIHDVDRRTIFMHASNLNTTFIICNGYVLLFASLIPTLCRLILCIRCMMQKLTPWRWHSRSAEACRTLSCLHVSAYKVGLINWIMSGNIIYLVWVSVCVCVYTISLISVVFNVVLWSRLRRFMCVRFNYRNLSQCHQPPQVLSPEVGIQNSVLECNFHCSCRTE